MEKQIGTYKLLRQLGKGGMGVVYLGENVETGEKAAVKVLPPELTRNSKYVERFRREAMAISRLDHPNIIKVFDVGEHNGVYYFAMEYLGGPTLRGLLKERGRLSTPEALQIATHISDALDLAHSCGIVHRDVKPDNIMADEHGTFKIMDFGIAHTEEGTQLTVTGTIMGTPEYMSPEQASAAPVDQRSDIYSMGIVLYEMLTGKVPFKADTAVEVLQMHVTRIPDPPKLLNPEIPGNLANVIAKMIEKKSANRYDSFRHVINALGQAVPESTRTAIRVTPRDIRPPSPVRKAEGTGTRVRERIVVEVPTVFKAALAASILLNLVLFGFLLFRMGEAPEPASPVEAAFTIGGQMFAPPVVSGSMLFLGAEDGTLYAYNLNEGAMEWTFQTGDKITAAPVTDGERVYVGSWDQNVYALDAMNGGTVVWKADTGGCIFAAPALSEGTLYVCTRDGRVFSIDAETGEENWRASSGTSVKLSPTVHDGAVFVPSDDRKLLAYRMDDGGRLASILTDQLKTPFLTAGEEGYFVSYNEAKECDELCTLKISSEASRPQMDLKFSERRTLRTSPSRE